jgi:ABC-type Fe3+/spermidine/putrescine transport system ATPase subunit
MDEPALRVESVSKRRNGRIVLDRLNLEAAPGAFLTILGAPGSGKTTLMDILAGFTRPASGHVHVHGQDMGGLSPRRRGFGVVMQNDVLLPHLTLAENIAYPLRFRRFPRADWQRMVAEALDLVQVGNIARRPHAASPAERQLVALARATVAGPKLLLLDEPLSAQDYAHRPASAMMLRRMHRILGVTTILATSAGMDALALSDQVAVLAGGRIAQCGPPCELYDNPATPEIAALTGEVSLLTGQIADMESGEARVRLTCGVSVEGTAAHGLRVRDRCVLGVRPERIAVAPVPASEMGENALDATIIEALPTGDQLRLRVLIGAGAELLVKRPAAAGLRGLAPGQTVAIAWQPAHAKIFAQSTIASRQSSPEH